jgi:hypothetical protein
MLAARMHGYRQPLVLEEVNIPEISSDQVLAQVSQFRSKNEKMKDFCL